jgi:hypothetical protein
MSEMLNTAAKSHTTNSGCGLCQLLRDHILAFDNTDIDVAIVTIVAVILAYFHVGLYLPTARSASSGDIPSKQKALRPSNSR